MYYFNSFLTSSYIIPNRPTFTRIMQNYCCFKIPQSEFHSSMFRQGWHDESCYAHSMALKVRISANDERLRERQPNILNITELSVTPSDD
jgi:hypothetical protein